MGLKNAARLVLRGIEELWEHRLSTAIIMILLIALIFVSTVRFAEPSIAQASVKTLSPPPATEQYFKGQATYDSTLIWESLSRELIGRAAQSGATIDDLQAQLDQSRGMGRTFDRIDYVGSYGLPDGRSMQFYVVSTRRSPVAEVDQTFYVFTLDQTGKILSVE
ncbi:MAG: hypothetical protein HY675_15105 [Chloroflexi bacterium]|nr:hypothetical protein [Chloroflexota bacterium]